MKLPRPHGVGVGHGTGVDGLVDERDELEEAGGRWRVESSTGTDPEWGRLSKLWSCELEGGVGGSCVPRVHCEKARR